MKQTIDKNSGGRKIFKYLLITLRIALPVTLSVTAIITYLAMNEPLKISKLDIISGHKPFHLEIDDDVMRPWRYEHHVFASMQEALEAIKYKEMKNFWNGRGQHEYTNWFSTRFTGTYTRIMLIEKLQDDEYYDLITKAVRSVNPNQGLKIGEVYCYAQRNISNSILYWYNHSLLYR